MRGLFGSLARRSSGPRNAAFSEPVWREIFGGAMTAAGEHVNWKTALQVTTALRCGLVIADGVATVPCKVMRKDPATGRRQEATDHPLNDVLTIAANGWMDSLQLRETLTIHTVFTGAGHSYINRVRGRIVELIPFEPGRCRPEQMPDYSIVYHVTAPNGEMKTLPASMVWEVRGPSWDGWRGLDIVHQAREALGLSLATEAAHAGRFGNGIQTSGTYSVEGNLDEAQHKRLTAWIKQHFTGKPNSGAPLVLDRAAKWQPMGLNGVDAEHVATRRLQIEEVCRAFGVMPIMVGFSDKASTYASAEQMFLAHAVHTIRPWHRRFEQSMKRQLLTREEVRSGYYIKFFETELLRGAAKDRAEYYKAMFSVAAFSPNLILELEDMDGYDGGEAHFVQAGVVPVADAGAATGSDASGQPTIVPQPPGSRPLNAGRVLSGENEGLIRNARDGLDTVLTKLDGQQEG